jgi:hypothetical protein
MTSALTPALHEPRSSGRQSAPYYPKQCWSRLTSAATIQGTIPGNAGVSPARFGQLLKK